MDGAVGVTRRPVAVVYDLVASVCGRHDRRSEPEHENLPGLQRRGPRADADLTARSQRTLLAPEGWIKPSLFDGIPNNNDLLYDGTQLQFKSVAQNRYLVADQGSGAAILADREQPSGWETFKQWRINETTFNFRVFGNQFVGVDSAGRVVATATKPGPSETFQLVRRDGDKSRVRIRAPNGLFLQAETMELVTADHGEDTDWGDDDPSVFVTNNVAGLQGEYQLFNGYGIRKARQVLRDHWRTFITESDFSFIASSGLDAEVQLGRYCGLACCAGVPNPYEHSATRDGSQEWGTNDENIDFLASRVRVNAVRRHAPTAYVIMPARLAADESELLGFAGRFARAVLDVHYYNLFSGAFDHLTVDQNIDFVRKNRSSDLAAVRAPSYVRGGEWVAEWNVREVQQDVYRRATFGWAYWMLKNNGYITLKNSLQSNAEISLEQEWDDA
ncbi:hypothetical protein SETIT_2G243300v2 [Setaria italica]|uniref:DUF7910 domain-containing protein n=1 Tax=Setaria italica TaxID=4555 RepID=A0A368Q275_SETIT|nr:hypothetical protein SETIT_2G243300v2 [Setaria italica]